MVGRAKILGPEAGAMWSLFWRAVLLTPLVMIVGGIWLFTWPLLIILPMVECFYVSEHAWFRAAGVAVAWLILFLLARSGWFKVDRKYFPNEQENI